VATAQYSRSVRAETARYQTSRAKTSQGADVIVSYPDIADGYLPVYKEATDAGIPVSTYAWGYVTGPGENYNTVVGEDTCALGKAFAEIMNEQVGSGQIALLGGDR